MSADAAFGQWLKRHRKELDLTQDELALHVGCSVVLIQKIEAGERRPSRQIAGLLATCLNIPADESPDFVRFARSTKTGFSPSDKSPWRALRHRLTNLPVPPTRIFGREQDIETIVRRIVHDRVRLLTLVGPPGIGKTRLALACAGEMLDYFQDGVFFVGLDPIREPGLVASTIARALGVTEIAGQSILTSLKQYLACKRVLVLLDNFEQVVAAAPLVAELLTHSPWLEVLATSRVSLHVRAEKQYHVAPLALPLLAPASDPGRLLESAAVQLFVDRAQSVEPDFRVSPQNASALAHICTRLDGLPLAIELVATHANTQSLQELLEQIDRRLALLTDGPCDLPPRHQSWRQAMDWSYDLLDAGERQLFAQFAVFVGGCTAQAVVQVCGDARPLARLVDKSLLTLEQQRYAMLETIREYALERLEQSGAANEMSLRHAHYFLALAEDAEPELTGPHQREWLDRLETEHHNLRAALRWTLETRDVEKALRMSGALWRFWQTRGYLGEGLEWLQGALNLPPLPLDSAIASARVQALLGAGWLLRDFGDFAKMKDCFVECLALLEQFENRPQLAYALYSKGYAGFLIGDQERGIQIIEASVALYRTLPGEPGIALPLFMLGRIAIGKGEYDCAQRWLIESLQVEKKRGATFGTARTLGSLGELAIYRGECVRAAGYLEESQSILAELNERQLYSWVLTKRGELAWRQCDLAHARSFLETSLDLSRETGYRWNTAYTLTYLGLVALSEGDAEQAQRLCEESLRQFRDLESEQDIAQTQKDLARVLLQRNNYAGAIAMYKKCLGVLVRRNCLPDLAECLEGLATAHSAEGNPRTAVQLLGAAEALRERIGAPLPPVLLASYEGTMADLHIQLKPETFARTYAEGRAFTLAQALDCAGSSGAQMIS